MVCVGGAASAFASGLRILQAVVRQQGVQGVRSPIPVSGVQIGHADQDDGVISHPLQTVQPNLRFVRLVFLITVSMMNEKEMNEMIENAMIDLLSFLN